MHLPAPNAPIGFEIAGQPTMGNAAYTDLLISQINMLPGVAINPIELTDTRIRVSIRALDLGCTLPGTGFPVMGTDSAVTPQTNYVDGEFIDTTGIFGNCGPAHFAWEDFAPLTGQGQVGDFVIRLITNFGNVNPMPDMGGGGDMNMSTDMNMSMDMGGSTDMSVDMTTPPVDMSQDDMASSTDMGATGDTGETAELSITSISPSTGPSDASTDVVILGTGFEPGAEVSIGARAIGVTSTVRERILATVPEGLPEGTYDLIVTNPGGDSAILPSAYTVSGTIDLTSRGDGDDGCGCDTTSSATTSWAAVIIALFLTFVALVRRREFTRR